MIIKKRFILLFFYLSFINANIIEFTITQYDINLPTPSVSYPNEKYSTTLPLNTFLSCNILWRTFQPKMITEKITNKLEIFIERTYKCEEYMTDIILNNLQINNLSFYIPNGLTWVRESGLALGYHIKDESFSIVHNLFFNKKIEKLQFAFYNLFNKDKGALYIGGIPSDKHKELPYKGIVRVNETLPTWGFKLKNIKYNNSVYQMNIPCIIHSAIDDVFISNDIFQFMVNSVFKEEIEKHVCESNFLWIYHQNYLVCKSVIKGGNRIKFDFESFSIDLAINDLFNQLHHSKFISNTKPNEFLNFSGAILGIGFLNLFNYTLFDYENKQIEFYSDTTAIKVNDNNQTLSFYIILSTISITTVNIAFLLINKFKSNN